MELVASSRKPSGLSSDLRWSDTRDKPIEDEAIAAALAGGMIAAFQQTPTAQKAVEVFLEVLAELKRMRPG